MREYKRFFILILIMTGVALIVGATAIAVLYQTALEEARFRLLETAQSQARLMEAVARFDRAYSVYPEGANAATLLQIRDAHEHFSHLGMGKTGEFTLARHEGNSIVFLLRHRHSELDRPEPVPFASGLAEPMKRALSGVSGTVIGPDYRGEMVLAAYEPVAILDLGIVAKIDLAEVRAPFLKAGGIVLTITVIVVAAGCVLFFVVGESIVRLNRESESRFRTLFENMSSGAAVYEAVAEGADFVFRDCNRAGEKIDQISRTELIGKRLTKVFPGVWKFGLLDVLKRVWQTGKPERYPTTFYDDERIEGWRDNYVYKLPTGEVVALYEDATERKKAEEALRESEIRMRALLDASQDDILLLSTDGVLLAINQAAHSRLAPKVGRPILIGSRIDELLPEDVVRRRMDMVDCVTTSGKLALFEEELYDRCFDYRVYPITRPDGRVSEVGVYARDITERKRAETDLRKLYQAIEQGPFAVIITDPRGNIEYVNPKFTEATGYALAEAIGKNPRILKSSHTPPDVYKRLWQTITSGGVWRGEFLNKKKSGELFWELASIAPVKDTDGHITHFIGVKEDITQRKATEEQLRQSQKMEAIGQLTGGIAHDFNNLLAIIIGNLQLLQERVEANEKTGEFMADALWSAKRGAELTHRLLAFARRQPLYPEVLNLNKVIAGMTELLRRTLGANIQVREQLAADLWKALADKGGLERALVNLAVNARDAMWDGGVLTIETRSVVLDQDYAEQHEEVAPGEYTMLAVTDTGTGMSPETMKRIFEPFFTTKEVGKGSGLGLSMVYGFIKQSGGHVSVSSEVGRGTTVTLFLPRAKAPAAIPEEPPMDALGDTLENKIVLVVEDEARLRKVARKMLKKMGLQVAEADSMKEALQRIEQLQRVDLLFTDLELPEGMVGAELAEEVRKLHPDIKIIYTTGYAKDTVLRNGQLRAEIPMISKPYSRSELARALKAVFTMGRDPH